MSSGNGNNSTSSNRSDGESHPFCEGLTDQHLQDRLEWMRSHVAKPIPEPIASFTDPQPASILLPPRNRGGGVLIGNKYHAAAVQNLVDLGVTAVLNCASGGISRLPVDELQDSGIQYKFTNVRQDHYNYPILHDLKTGQTSDHFKVAAALYQDVVVQKKGKILFFCVAGQNRSAALAVAVLLLFGNKMERILPKLGEERPFVLENIGYQKQLVELEYMLQNSDKETRHQVLGDMGNSSNQPSQSSPVIPFLGPLRMVEIEMLIPGLCTMEVKIPVECTISALKQILVDHANVHLLSFYDKQCTVAKSWMILAMFGYNDMYDIPLEEEAISRRIQIERMRKMFNLNVTKRKAGKQDAKSTKDNAVNGDQSYDDEWVVHWHERCRLALVIFSVNTVSKTLNETVVLQEPWRFIHEERSGAPATFLENTLNSTHLRAWDFVSGKSYTSRNPIVFCYENEEKSSGIGRIDRRAFMKVSNSANEPLQYHEPGQILLSGVNGKQHDNSGYILGMGENAIVHRVQLEQASSGKRQEVEVVNTEAHMMTIDEDGPLKQDSQNHTKQVTAGGSTSTSSSLGEYEDDEDHDGWDAAVKRPYTLSKMLASLQSSSSEAGLAKRLRFANSLNSDGRIVQFYGLGIAFACDAANPSQFKYELVLLSRKFFNVHCYLCLFLLISLMSMYSDHDKNFATFTLKRFLDEYVRDRPPEASALSEIARIRSSFTIISIKVLLVSLLNAFRDLTLLGVRSFDFALSNVLVSQDFKSVRLIDVDGGSISSASYGTKFAEDSNMSVMKPGLQVDLNVLLPDVVCRLLLGKGRGSTFVTNIRSEIWHAKEEEGKEIIKRVMRENFYAHLMDVENSSEELDKAEHHLDNVAFWYYAVLKKKSPWKGWTNDIYDAMRCIDHLPIA